ncbi:MAG TPA: hypothetical protein DDY17_03230 [Syntrophaceae bacterium]|jgi:uncharacterized metal-binding protein|nr:hypothetical protein [Syntrophaceae bacterium]
MSKFKIVMTTCYGAANTGQLAGAITTELVKENEDFHLLCLPAVAINKETGINKVKNAEIFVIIEGCPVMCCTKIVEEHTGRKPDIRVEMAEDYGVKKSSELTYEEAEKVRIKQDIKRRIEDKSAGRN